MARIIDGKRKLIVLSVDDVLNVVRSYQQLTNKCCCYEHIRENLAKSKIYLPED